MISQSHAIVSLYKVQYYKISIFNYGMNIDHQERILTIMLGIFKIHKY